MRAFALAVVLACMAQAGCSSSPCRDRDGDGRGEGCEAGEDCDDGDPALAGDCSPQARDCARDPFEPGCPCLAGARRDCYSGPPASAELGPCRMGRQSCAGGRWSACEGEVLPVFETCNGEDDDCDAISDEGALSPCGGCNPDCRGGVWGAEPAPFEAEGELAVTELGELTLRQHPVEARTVWVPNTGEGTVSKVDAASAREIARYRVAGEPPERVAVDHDGDAWVLSPGFMGESRLTKVAGESARCVDRDGDGVRSSSGPSDVLPLGEDECVLVDVPVGGALDVARALAVAGNVWVALARAQELLELDRESGEVLRSVATPGFAAYAAVFDPWGTLWMIDRAGLLARVEPAAGSIEVIEAPLRCYELESLASDERGVLTLTGFACEDVIVYDPRRELWDHAAMPGVLDTRGVAVLGELSWVVHTGGSISRIRRDPLGVEATFGLASAEASPIESIAMGADSLGQLWVVSSMGAPSGAGVLTRFDPEREEVTAQVPLGWLPRARGDITGALRHPVFAGEASAAHVFEGCSGDPTDWQRMHVGYLAGEGASIVLAARHAPDRERLAAAPWLELGTLPDDEPPFELPFESGGVVEARLTLRVTGQGGAPRVGRVGLQWACAGPD